MSDPGTYISDSAEWPPIAGLHKCSFVDYPGKLAAVVFTAGCNMDCFYCHNHQLIEASARTLTAENVLSFLDRRRGTLDAVVVTGGEPTLHAGLAKLLRRIREMGFAVKLDTNGTNPARLQQLLGAGLVDYVAMDVKAPTARYGQITCRGADRLAIERSIDLLLSAHVDTEFRTTFAPPLTQADILQIAHRLRGAKRFALQQYRIPAHAPVDAARPHPDEHVLAVAELARTTVAEVVVRGVSEHARAAHTPASPATSAAAG